MQKDYLDNSVEYRFSVQNNSSRAIYEPYTKTLLPAYKSTDFTIVGNIAYNSVVKNLQQLAQLHKSAGFDFDINQIEVQTNQATTVDSKIIITVQE